MITMLVLFWLTAVLVHPSHSNPASAPRWRHCVAALSHLRQVPALRAKRHPSHGYVFGVSSTCGAATGTGRTQKTSQTARTNLRETGGNTGATLLDFPRPSVLHVQAARSKPLRTYSKMKHIARQSSTTTGGGADGGHECTPCGNLDSPNHFESKITAYTKAFAASKLHNSSKTCGGYRR